MSISIDAGSCHGTVRNVGNEFGTPKKRAYRPVRTEKYDPLDTAANQIVREFEMTGRPGPDFINWSRTMDGKTALTREAAYMHVARVGIPVLRHGEDAFAEAMATFHDTLADEYSSQIVKHIMREDMIMGAHHHSVKAAHARAKKPRSLTPGSAARARLSYLKDDFM